MGKRNIDKLTVLTSNEEKFCVEFVKPTNYRNQSAAYRKAFPKSVKWQDKSVHERACRLMKKDKIKSRIVQLQEIIKNNMIADIQEITIGLTRDMRFDPRKLFNENGNIKNIKDLDEETALSLCGYEETEKYDMEGNPIITRKIKFPEKNKSRELMGRSLNMFKEDNKAKGAVIVLSPGNDNKEKPDIAGINFDDMDLSGDD